MLVEREDRWIVALAGLTVTLLELDHAFTLIAGSFTLRVEQSFELQAPDDGGIVAIDPEGDPVRMGPALVVLHQDVREAVAFKDGRLELTVADGSVLRVGAGEEYEAWILTGPGGLRIVSLPGGELAIWTPGAAAEPDG